MLSALVLVLVILAVGGGLSDRLRLRQEEVILGKLPLEGAHAYYRLLVARNRRFRVMRGLCLLSVFVLIYIWRHTRAG